MIKQLLSAVLLLFLAVSCLKDKTAPVSDPDDFTCADTVFFKGEILPEIFSVNCSVAGCHNSEDAANGYVFETYEEIATYAEVILLAIQHDPTVTPMPYLGDQIQDSLIQKFECWIEQGKLNN